MEPGKPQTYIGDLKDLEGPKTEEKKQDVEMKPPEEFIYESVNQNEGSH